jgi:hypothetical protein
MSASSAPSCCTGTGESSSPGRCATSAPRSGSTIATASSRRLRSGLGSPAGARGDRRLHVPAPVAARRDRRVRRALRDGLRGCRLCLRCWQAGHRVTYAPSASLEHSESVTRGTDLGERERESQRYFWQRWGEFFDARQVRTPMAAADRLRDRGHRHRRRPPRHLRAPQPVSPTAATMSRSTPRGAPEWFDLRVPTAHLRGLRGAGRCARAARRDQGRDLVEHGASGLAGEHAARNPGLLRAGHRDELLPRQRARATACSRPTATSFAT